MRLGLRARQPLVWSVISVYEFLICRRRVTVLGGMMALSQDAIRLYEQDLLQKADMLAIGLKGLRSADAGRAAELLVVITDRLEGAAVGEDAPAAAPAAPAAAERQKAPVGATRRGR